MNLTGRCLKKDVFFSLQHPMKPAMIPRPGMMQKPQHIAYHHPPPPTASTSGTSQPGSLTHRSGAWQSTLSGGQGAEGGHHQPQLVIPRAKVKPKSSYQGYNSDEDRLSEVYLIVVFLYR